MDGIGQSVWRLAGNVDMCVIRITDAQLEKRLQVMSRWSALQ